jgi:hypothetical protein
MRSTQARNATFDETSSSRHREAILVALGPGIVALSFDAAAFYGFCEMTLSLDSLDVVTIRTFFAYDTEFLNK